MKAALAALSLLLPSALAAAAPEQSGAEVVLTRVDFPSWSLAIHGGAGVIDKSMPEEKKREYFAALLRKASDGWIDHRAANYALEQLSFGITTSSTRSAMALMGYLSWRQAFIGHRAAAGRRDIPGLMSARSKHA